IFSPDIPHLFSQLRHCIAEGYRDAGVASMDLGSRGEGGELSSLRPRTSSWGTTCGTVWQSRRSEDLQDCHASRGRRLYGGGLFGRVPGSATAGGNERERQGA